MTPAFDITFTHVPGGYRLTPVTDRGRRALAGASRPDGSDRGPIVIDTDLMTDTIAELTWSGVTVGRDRGGAS